MGYKEDLDQQIRQTRQIPRVEILVSILNFNKKQNCIPLFLEFLFAVSKISSSLEELQPILSNHSYTNNVFPEKQLVFCHRPRNLKEILAQGKCPLVK